MSIVAKHAQSNARDRSVADLAAVTDPCEERVLRQLVEAMLWEGVVCARRRPRHPSDVGIVAGIPAIYDEVVELELGGRVYRCMATTRAFGRIRVARGSIRECSAGRSRDARLADLVASLPAEPRALERLSEELTQTVALCRWNRDHTSHHLVPRRALAFERLEAAITEGHPYHPSFKARTGFSVADHRAYGFEAANVFRLAWFAVHRAKARTALPGPVMSFWRTELGERELGVLTERLLDAGGDWDAFVPVPVHPFQVRAIYEQVLAPGIADGWILPLGLAGDLYRATQSLRTLVNDARPERANVKLPLDIVCTSSPRNFRRHFVCTAPALSAWLRGLVEDDPFLRATGHLLLLEEYAATLYDPEPPASGSEEPSMAHVARGKIGVIFRESVVGKLRAGEAAVPFTALTVEESDGRAFIAEWLDAHGTAAWCDRLLEVMLLPIWHMLVHHGVAFEAHAQNLILIHRGGWPERIVLRDFHDDTELVDSYLREPSRVPRFADIDPYFATVPDDDGYRMGSTDDLAELFMDTVFVFNLADLAFAIERWTGLPETRFWRLARAHLAAYRASGITEVQRIDAIGAGRDELIVESLLTKKLRGGGLLDYEQHRVANTLRGI